MVCAGYQSNRLLRDVGLRLPVLAIKAPVSHQVNQKRLCNGVTNKYDWSLTGLQPPHPPAGCGAGLEVRGAH